MDPILVSYADSIERNHQAIGAAIAASGMACVVLLLACVVLWAIRKYFGE